MNNIYTMNKKKQLQGLNLLDKKYSDLHSHLYDELLNMTNKKFNIENSESKVFSNIGDFLKYQINEPDNTVNKSAEKLPSIKESEVNADNIKEYFIENIGDSSESNPLIQTSNNNLNDASNVKQKIVLNKIMGALNNISIRNLFNPRARYTTNYLILNNQFSSNNTDGRYSISWGISESVMANQDGVINTSSNISNIVAMRMSALTFTCRTSFTKNIVARKRISVLIKELSAQAFIAPEGNKYHFIGAPIKYYSYIGQPITGNETYGPSSYINTTSFYYWNHGNFYFQFPIKKIDTLTISLYCPFQPFPLDNENISGYVVQSSNPAQIVFSTEHGLYQDSITISNFTTGNPTTDAALISAMNTTFTYPNFTVVDSFTITVPVNLTGMTTLTNNPSINGYRIVQLITHLELVSLCDEEDGLL